METYSVTVNGVTYEVQVEKKLGLAPTAASVSKVLPVVAAVQMPKASNAALSEVAGTKITAGAAGKIWKIVAAEGQSVKAGDPIVILEAMKMEIPIVAPKDGVILKITVSEGNPIEAGDLLATMN